MSGEKTETTKRRILRREGPGVTELVLNRPEAANSLSEELVTDLSVALTEIASRRDVRVVVLSAAGKVFCAGMDLREASEASPPRTRGAAEGVARVALQLQRLPQPVIAKVRGVATAAGLQLVLSCDLAYASSGSRFATPGVNIGLWCFTPMVPLARAVAPRRALELLLTGELIEASRALEIGLVNEVLADELLDARVGEVAALIASKSPATVALGKRTFYEQLGLAPDAAYALVSERVEANARHPDAREGIRAFLEKRPPRWSEGG